jgi:hypothetical protein
MLYYRFLDEISMSLNRVKKPDNTLYLESPNCVKTIDHLWSKLYVLIIILMLPLTTPRILV